MKSAVITGVAGQDGAYLAHHLRGLGYRVIGTVPDAPIPAGFVETYLKGVDVRTVDLTDRAGMRALLASERPDEIYNLASISSVAQSWSHPVEVTQVNGVAVLGLLEEIRQIRDETGYAPRLCQASSSEIFGIPQQLPQAEGSPIVPTSPYGSAKALAHHSVVNHRNAYGLHASTVILFNHESPLRPPTFVTRKVTAAVARLARGGTQPLELGRQDVLRDWGAASDYVRAMHLSLQPDNAGDYVVASGEAHSLGELVETAFEAAGMAYDPSLVLTNQAFIRPTDVPEMRGDPRRAELVLGWHRRIGFRACIRAMVQADLRRIDTGVEHDMEYLTMATEDLDGSGP